MNNSRKLRCRMRGGDHRFPYVWPAPRSLLPVTQLPRADSWRPMDGWMDGGVIEEQNGSRSSCPGGSNGKTASASDSDAAVLQEWCLFWSLLGSIVLAKVKMCSKLSQLEFLQLFYLSNNFPFEWNKDTRRIVRTIGAHPLCGHPACHSPQVYSLQSPFLVTSCSFLCIILLMEDEH